MVESTKQDDDRPRVVIVTTEHSDKDGPQLLVEKLRLKEGDDRIDMSDSKAISWKIVTQYYTAEAVIEFMQLPKVELSSSTVLGDEQIQEIQAKVGSIGNIQVLIFYIESEQVSDLLAITDTLCRNSSSTCRLSKPSRRSIRYATVSRSACSS